MKSLSLLLLSFFLFSCGPESEVKWPSLNELDNISASVTKAVENREFVKQKQLLKEASALITQVNSNVPSNVKNRQEVKVYLKDLNSLSPQLAKVDELSEGETLALSHSLAPIISQIMTSAGVPHSCSTCAGCAGH